MRFALNRDRRDGAPAVVEREGPDLSGIRAVTGRRSLRPIDRLSRELNEACTTAVTAHQIAALLEVEGLNDRIVQQRYARPTVFALAADLYDRVPMRRSADSGAVTDSDPAGLQRSTAALIMRGPIFLVPVLFFVATGELLVRERMVWAGLLGLLLAWAWNQGFGVLLHRLIARGDLPGARLVARLSLAAGTILVTLVVWVVAANDGSVARFVAGETAYLVAATTLLTLGKDRLLALVLLPGAIVVMVTLAFPGALDGAALPATIVTVLLVVGAMAWTTRDGNRGHLPPLTQSDLSVAGCHALLGAVWAVLIGLAGFSIMGTTGVVAAVGLAAVPMVLTMGVAEWQLRRLRHDTRMLLIATRDPKEFARRARRSFARSTAGFAGALIVASALVGLGAVVSGVLTGPGMTLAFGFAWLGIAFFAGLALVSMERIVIPLSASICLVAFMGYLLAATSPGALGGAWLYAAGCFGLCLGLVAAAFAVIPMVVVHR